MVSMRATTISIWADQQLNSETPRTVAASWNRVPNLAPYLLIYLGNAKHLAIPPGTGR